jgi:hypothetical protein
MGRLFPLHQRDELSKQYACRGINRIVSIGKITEYKLIRRKKSVRAHITLLFAKVIVPQIVSCQ